MDFRALDELSFDVDNLREAADRPPIPPFDLKLIAETMAKSITEAQKEVDDLQFKIEELQYEIEDLKNDAQKGAIDQESELEDLRNEIEELNNVLDHAQAMEKEDKATRSTN